MNLPAIAELIIEGVTKNWERRRYWDQMTVLIFPLGPLGRIDWRTIFLASATYPKFWWRPRGDGPLRLFFGTQTNFTLEQLDDWRLKWQDFPAIYCYGGNFFDQQSEQDPQWALFGNHWHLAPIQIWQEGPVTMVALLYSQADGEGSPKKIIQQIQQWGERTEDMVGEHCGQVKSTVATPGYFEWDKMVASAHALIGTQDISKVVLARRTTLHFSQKIALETLAPLLVAKREHFTICWSAAPSVHFISQSPELFLFIENDHLQTEALAGTIAGEDSSEVLVNSGKNRREHQIVVDDLKEELENLGANLVTPTIPRILQQTFVQHLQTAIHAKLPVKWKLERIIRHIHPTAALGGVPRARARRFLTEYEPFSRGLYGAPLGIVGPAQVHLAVGIRSALINQTQLHIYAGAGIVSESIGRDEWIEIDNKMKNFTQWAAQYFS